MARIDNKKIESKMTSYRFLENLKNCNTVTEAADYMGVHRNTIHRKMNQLGISAKDIGDRDKIQRVANSEKVSYFTTLDHLNEALNNKDLRVDERNMIQKTIERISERMKATL